MEDDKLDELAKAFLQNGYIWELLGEAGTLRLGRDELIALIRESHKFISKKKGTIPEYYKEEYLAWVKNNSNKS